MPPEGQSPPAQSSAPRKTPPLGGTVVKADAAKKQIIIKVADGKGKSEDRTIDVKEGVKLLGPTGEEAELGGFIPGQTVLFQEKDGKVTQLQIFKLGGERIKAKK